MISLFLFGLVATEAFFELRFTISRPFFASAAQKYIETANADLSIQFHEHWDGPSGFTEAYDDFKAIGLFRVIRVNVPTENCARFLTTLGGRDGGGVVYYSGDGEPPNLRADYYRHLYGSWWHWETDF